MFRASLYPGYLARYRFDRWRYSRNKGRTMIIVSPRIRAATLCAVAAAIGGAAVAFHYHRLGLTLSHYDARGHLVVARRIVDSITPGWQQIGAVWLPLPHLLNVIPVQIDAFYRSGASAVAISVAAFAIATGAIGWIVAVLTDSALAAVVAAALFALNPNVLYLQATPMTEPLVAAAEVWWGVRMLSGGSLVLIGALAGLIGIVSAALAKRHRARFIVVASLAAAAALPWSAFVNGHPFRIRYMVPLLTLEAIGAGSAVGLLQRFRS